MVIAATCFRLADDLMGGSRWEEEDMVSAGRREQVVSEKTFGTEMLKCRSGSC
jgi:hypothetical protein